MLRKRFLALIMSILVSSAQIQVVIADNVLTMDQAIQLAIKNSPMHRDIVVEKIKKRSELIEAREALRTYNRGRFLIDFKLLLSIKVIDQWEGMPKELQLIMNIPQLQSDLKMLDQKKIDETYKTRNKVELAYYDITVSDYRINFFSEMLEDKTKTLEKIKRQRSSGDRIDPADLEMLEDQVEEYKEKLRKEQLANDRLRKSLGDMIGVNIRNNYTLGAALASCNITREQLPQIIDYGKKKDFSLYTATSERRIADTYVYTLMDVYSRNFGRFVSDVNRYIRTTPNIDYDQFLNIYDYHLYMDDSPWHGSYVINLLFFKIYIPKEWFKSKWAGTRYLKDKKYELFLSVVELDKAKEKEKQAIADYETKIHDAYYIVKELEASVKQMQQSLSVSERNYDRDLKNNMLGLTSFAALESEKTNMKNLQLSIQETKTEYAKALSMMDMYTCGYVSSVLLKAVSGPGSDYESGISFMGEEDFIFDEIPGAQWSILQSIDDYKFKFRIKLPDDIKATDFELYTPEGQLIGSRTPVSDELIGLPLTFSDSTNLELKLYNKGILAYTAQLDGMQYGGPILLRTSTDVTAAEGIGTYKIVRVTSLTGSIQIDVTDNTDYDSFDVLVKNNLIGTAPKGGEVVHLFTSINDDSVISIILKKNGESVKTLVLNRESGESGYLAAAD